MKITITFSVDASSKQEALDKLVVKTTRANKRHQISDNNPPDLKWAKTVGLRFETKYSLGDVLQALADLKTGECPKEPYWLAKAVEKLSPGEAAFLKDLDDALNDDENEGIEEEKSEAKVS